MFFLYFELCTNEFLYYTLQYSGNYYKKNCIAYFTKAHTLLLRLKYIDTHKTKRTLHMLIEFKEPVFAVTET